jgi:hypothetical protein
MLLMFSVVVPLFWSVTVARCTTNRTLLRLIPILHGRMCHLGGPVVFLLRLLFFARFALSGAEARTGTTKTALVQRTYRPKGGPQEIDCNGYSGGVETAVRLLYDSIDALVTY